MERAASEAKGIWFIALQRYLLDEYGEAALAAVVAAMHDPYREALSNPMISTWYPEEALADALHAVRAELARGNDRRFVSMIAACTEQGISRFFRVLLRLASPQFVLKQVPTLWRQTRRGPGHVTVRVEKNTVIVHYADFPFLCDRVYHQLTEGALRGLLSVASKSHSVVRIQDHGQDWITMRVALSK